MPFRAQFFSEESRILTCNKQGIHMAINLENVEPMPSQIKQQIETILL